MNSAKVTEVAGGKRDDPNYAQVSGFVPKELALQFKATCTLQEVTQSEALEKAIKIWLEQVKKGK